MSFLGCCSLTEKERLVQIAKAGLESFVDECTIRSDFSSVDAGVFILEKCRSIYQIVTQKYANRSYRRSKQNL